MQQQNDVRYGPYYKNELEMKSNSSKILPVDCKLSVILLHLN